MSILVRQACNSSQAEPWQTTARSLSARFCQEHFLSIFFFHAVQRNVLITMSFSASGTIFVRIDRQGHFGTDPYYENPTESFRIAQDSLLLRVYVGSSSSQRMSAGSSHGIWLSSCCWALDVVGSDGAQPPDFVAVILTWVWKDEADELCASPFLTTVGVLWDSAAMMQKERVRLSWFSGSLHCQQVVRLCRFTIQDAFTAGTISMFATSKHDWGVHVVFQTHWAFFQLHGLERRPKMLNCLTTHRTCPLKRHVWAFWS